MELKYFKLFFFPNNLSMFVKFEKCLIIYVIGSLMVGIK